MQKACAPSLFLELHLDVLYIFAEHFVPQFYSDSNK